MELIRGIHNLHARHHGCVLTIGNFDGFHRGHQALISELRSEGQRRNLPVMAIIFEPQPQEYFSKSAAPARLTLLRDKVKYLATAKVDIIVCVHFNKRFSSINAYRFLTDYLVKKIGVRLISIGCDFRFGSGRQGDFMLLQQVGKETGFEVMKSTTHIVGNQRVSSTRVRNALSQDQLEEAEILLGHPYQLSGRVVYGDALGRTIGFPTANLSLNGRRVALNGVYVVEVLGLTNKPVPGIANIGNRPTVSGLNQKIEVHLLDINKNIYGYHLDIIIKKKVRQEKRFPSLESLKQQIANDVISARHYFEFEKPQNSIH
ncbi:riboflavin kinase/FMN adenylyltransferase [secondary endosymbiont of Heteropsylla cubana]|uniref:Riboflavin biosynthesis protein n=1 Tax=secondary endosymbiont of Heteropsylla cubana TaxID=134287 RepID=J3TGW9_9ENTR|nr:bifunctional riboflavin kinase/FAD synthetase [secondary endosymbiont of Heteropsylla cubana]AFP85772.1 riboflavin kinase/FMN adenylyltransferase [secondary endosymbiont of Heteropsylla cubana]